MINQEYFDSKEALVDVTTGLREYQHYSVLINEDEVLVFERIEGNSPQWAFMKWNSVKEYIDSIKDVDWIIENIKEDDLINEYLSEEEFSKI